MPLQLAERLCLGHFVPFLASVRARTRVGERILWGNVAASLAVVFRAVQANGPVGDAAVRERAEQFFTAAEPWLGGLGHWSTIRTPDALGWYFDRTTCCLYYKCASSFSCDDCSLTDPAGVRSAPARGTGRRPDMNGPER